MSLSTITALSPLDGRYAPKLAALRPIMSEHGYMHRRVQVDGVMWVLVADTSSGGLGATAPANPAPNAPAAAAANVNKHKTNATHIPA